MASNGYSTGVAVIGIGESDIGKSLGRSSHSLYAQAINEAIRDAGLDKSQIDGLVTIDSNAEPRTRHAMSVAQYVGLNSEKMQWIQTSKHGSVASSGGTLREAMMSIRSGVCDYVVIAGAESEGSAGSDVSLTKKAERRDAEFESPFGTLIVATFAMFARKYMSDYGATEEDLAEVSVAARAWANLHPKAQMGKVRITKEDVLASPMVASPLRRLNCSLVSDGGTAMVLTSLERAREYGDRAPYMDVPTLTELGYPQIKGTAYSLNAPVGVPKAVLDKLYSAASQALRQPGVIAGYDKLGVDIVNNTPELAAKRLAAEARLFVDIARSTNAKLTE